MYPTESHSLGKTLYSGRKIRVKCARQIRYKSWLMSNNIVVKKFPRVKHGIIDKPRSLGAIRFVLADRDSDLYIMCYFTPLDYFPVYLHIYIYTDDNNNGFHTKTIRRDDRVETTRNTNQNLIKGTLDGSFSNI